MRILIEHTIIKNTIIHSHHQINVIGHDPAIELLLLIKVWLIVLNSFFIPL